MTDAVTATFDVGQRLGVMEGIPVARQDFNLIIITRFVEQMGRKVLHAAFPSDAGRLDDHARRFRIRSRSASIPSSVAVSSALCPISFPKLARRTN